MAMDVIRLIEPKDHKEVSLKGLLEKRHSVRAYKDKALSIQVVSTLLWSAYGTKRGGGRVVASAGGIYPIHIYLVAKKIELDDGRLMPQGIFYYRPETDELVQVKKGDIAKEIARASLSQLWMADAPCMIVIACEYRKITSKYRERGIRYAHMEAGSVAQNISLCAVNNGLGCCIVGAFDDERVKECMGIERPHEPLLIIPIGQYQD